MLLLLKHIHFNVLWPEHSWEDIGFSESPIWIDGLGYGYYSCDQPNIYYKAARIPNGKWKQIRQKLADRTLMPEDLADTSLSKMYFCENTEEFSCDYILSLLALPEIMEDYYYCADGYGEARFFRTKEDMAIAIRNECGNHETLWKELPDERLKIWVERLCDGKYDQGFDFFEEV